MDAPRGYIRSEVNWQDNLVFYDNTLIGVLPVEIVVKIFSYLNRELVSVGSVCKYWNSIAFQELFERGMHSMEMLQVCLMISL